MMAYKSTLLDCTASDQRAAEFLSTKMRYTITAILVASVTSGCSSLQSVAGGFYGSAGSKETIVERYTGPDASLQKKKVPLLHYVSSSKSSVRSVGSLTSRWRPVKSAVDHDADGVLDAVDRCPDTTDFVTVGQDGCGLFDVVLDDVKFLTGSMLLSPHARAQLDHLAEVLQVFPEARIEVRAHTDSRGSKKANMVLSSHRADVTVKYLQSRGVHSPQMKAVGMGEGYPLYSNDTKKGRERNRRVDVVTLPDRDTANFILARNEISNDGISNGVEVAIKDLKKGPQANTDLTAPLFPLTADNDQGEHAKFLRWRAPDDNNSSVVAPLLAAAQPLPKQSSKQFSSVKSSANIKPLPRPGVAPYFTQTGVLENVSFDSGSSLVSGSTQTALQPLVDELLSQVSVRIVIMAHTDDQGDAQENTRLSVKRADAVVDYLVAQGVDATRLKAEGYGEALPLVQNISPANRERNRRIEIRVMNTNQ